MVSVCICTWGCQPGEFAVLHRLGLTTSHTSGVPSMLQCSGCHHTARYTLIILFLSQAGAASLTSPPDAAHRRLRQPQGCQRERVARYPLLPASLPLLLRLPSQVCMCVLKAEWLELSRFARLWKAVGDSGRAGGGETAVDSSCRCTSFCNHSAVTWAQPVAAWCLQASCTRSCF
jgi:hypothetical protein